MKGNITISLLLLTTCTIAKAQTTADAEIYIDYPIGKWVVRGTAEIDHASSVFKRSHHWSIRISLGAGEEARFDHTWEGQDTNQFTDFEFWVNGGTNGGQRFSIQAVINGQPGPMVPVSNYTNILPNTWSRVKVPLAALGAQNVRFVNKFILKETSGQAQSDFWVDDVRVIRNPGLATPTLRVFANEPVATLSKRMFGIATFVSDWTLTNPGTIQRIREAGFTMMSYPGGRVGDVYNWRDNVNGLDGTQGVVDSNAFASLSAEVGTDSIFTVNYGSGTPQLARDWVHHMNVVRGANIKYWVIGNEVYGTDYDWHEYRNDALTYAQFVRDCIVMMKAVDPTIKIGVSGTISEWDYPQRVSVTNPRTGRVRNGWGPVLLTRLRELGVTPDFWDFHLYPTAPGKESDAFLLNSSDRPAYLFPIMRQMITDYLGEAGNNVKIYLTENNATWTPVGKQTTSMTNALYLANIWAESAVNGADGFVWWNLHNPAYTNGNNHPSLESSREYGDFGVLSIGTLTNGEPLNTPYPTFYAFKLLKVFARPGDTLVRATSDNHLLPVYASKSAQDGRIRLLILNKSKDQEIRGALMIHGQFPRPRIKLYQYSRSDDQSDSNVREWEQHVFGARVMIKAPPYSITVVEL